jgi:chemotaxis protein methyltransferase CheR
MTIVSSAAWFPSVGLTNMDEYFDNIARFLRDKCRLYHSGHKKTVLRRRLEGRLAQLELPDFAAYWQYLLDCPAEERQLIALATTNETSFFRNSAQFDSLREMIVPRLLSGSSPGEKRIRVLSAGCSTGEEPYSIAMTLFGAMPLPGPGTIEIVAGDVSDVCLESARRGVYEADRLDRLPPGYRERFTVPVAGGAMVTAELKSVVRFVPLNLAEIMADSTAGWHLGVGAFDIIFCRNVMIYFAPSCQQSLVDTLHKLLLPGGYLFTGDAEPLHLFQHDFRTVDVDGCLIYQKTE